MARTFLDLLLDEAPASAFERLLRQSTEPADHDDSYLVKAMRVRTLLERRRRREIELAALYETAGDLTALRDVDLVLTAIVRRARQLLGTDVAYLTLIDEERGDTYMRVVEGGVSARFRRVRLPVGVGLGGLVAQTSSPYFTAHYLTDERFRHTRQIDSAVADEGLVAILGVPLVLGTRLIGGLFAANRDERPFLAEEVALLSSLAAHAAIATENARLFGDNERALEKLSNANDLLAAGRAALEHTVAAHDQLTETILGGGTMDDIARVAADLLHGSILVADQEGRLVAYAGDAVDEVDRRARTSGRLPETTSAGKHKQAGLGVSARLSFVAAKGAGPSAVAARWLAPVVAGTDQAGVVVLTRRDAVEEGELRILERAAQTVALVQLWQRSLADAEHRARGDLFGDLLAAPERDPDGLRRRGDRLGVDFDAEHCVVVATADEHRRGLARAAAAAAGELGGTAAEYRRCVVALLPAGDPAEAGRELVARTNAVLGHPVTAGVAGPARGPAALAEAYRTAHRCLKLLCALGREGESASAMELGVYGLVFANAGREDLTAFIEATLGPILAYDHDRGTDLLGTLAAFFHAGRQATRAAEALHVHTNTFYQRLNRVETLLGAQWQSPESTLQLELALRLYHLRTPA